LSPTAPRHRVSPTTRCWAARTSPVSSAAPSPADSPRTDTMQDHPPSSGTSGVCGPLRPCPGVRAGPAGRAHRCWPRGGGSSVSDAKGVPLPSDARRCAVAPPRCPPCPPPGLSVQHPPAHPSVRSLPTTWLSVRPGPSPTVVGTK
jgi:hypothetical protein